MSPSSAITAGHATAPLLRFEDIGKSFSGVRVLQGVSFTLAAGEIMGLVGENGAGKSTLMNVLGGNLAPDTGRLWLDGRPFAPRSPAAARAAGIAFVHQELNLFPNLTIAENLGLGAFPRRARSPFIDRRALVTRARELLQLVGLEHSPERPVAELSAGECQLVEIARALGLRARILILDEPTTSLTAHEAARLFEVMRRLRRDGMALIFISHTLGDVLRECDPITVLRDGQLVRSGRKDGLDVPGLVALMVGRELTQLFPTRRVGPHPGTRPAAPPLLTVRDVSRQPVVRDISFSLHAGEILGFAGLMGAGRSELARLLFGLDAADAGEIRLEGQPLPRGPQRRIASGLAFLTEDRRADGLCLDAAIADNVALVTLRRHARTATGWLDLVGLRHVLRQIREAVRLTPSAPDDQPVRTLSGGNQQKVVLAKWLLAQPKVLILDEPTRGIDVGARFEVYQLIQQLADAGTGVLLISSELEELLGLCDRILVLARGRIRDELPRADFDPERILRAAIPE